MLKLGRNSRLSQKPVSLPFKIVIFRVKGFDRYGAAQVRIQAGSQDTVAAACDCLEIRILGKIIRKGDWQCCVSEGRQDTSVG